MVSLHPHYEGKQDRHRGKPLQQQLLCGRQPLALMNFATRKRFRMTRIEAHRLIRLCLHPYFV
jgi:hypothetical protein